MWRYDTLCKERSRFGFFALYFFFGIVSTIILVPKLSDLYGRRWLFIVTMAVSTVAQFVLLVSDDLLVAQIMMFFLGTTFGGKMIVALSYLIEFMTSYFIETIVFIVLIVEPIITILITFWYQFIDRGWLIL